jgi:hypothetical protein
MLSQPVKYKFTTATYDPAGVKNVWACVVLRVLHTLLA